MAREMRNSGVRWIGDIPSNWKVLRTKNLCTISSGTTPKSEVGSYWDGDIKWITPADFKTIDKWVSCGRRNISEIGKAVSHLTAFPKDSIVFSKRAPIGQVSIMLDDLCINQGCFGCVVNDRVSNIFLYYLLSSFTEQFELLGSGTTFKEISASNFANFKLPLPPLTEQKVIADFLDAKCGEIDGLLADMDAEVKTLTEYKKSIIAETVTRGLNPNAPMKSSGIPWADIIPAHWEIDKGKFRFELRRTKGNPRNLELMSPTQKYGVIPQSQLEGVVLVKENTDLNAFRTICIGDFCISLRSFQGGFEYSNYEGVVSPAYQVFYPIKPIADGYFKFVFKSDGFISYINTFSMSLRDGKNIAFEDFGNSYIPIPPLNEQKVIAKFLDDKCAAIDQAITDKTQQIETLKAYKSSLIYEYVTGKKQVL